MADLDNHNQSATPPLNEPIPYKDTYSTFYFFVHDLLINGPLNAQKKNERSGQANLDGVDRWSALHPWTK